MPKNKNKKKQSVDRANSNSVRFIHDQIEKAKKEAGLPEPDELTIHFAAEVKYVRRTAAEFRAGAEPIAPGQNSHRMTRTSLMLSPEMIKSIKMLGDVSDVDRMKWIRAAIRFALRHPDEFDPKAELDREFTIHIDKSKGIIEPQ